MKECEWLIKLESLLKVKHFDGFVFRSSKEHIVPDLHNRPNEVLMRCF